MIIHSLRWRLQIWHSLTLLAVLAGFGYTAYRLQYSNELRRVDQELEQHLGPVRDALRRPAGILPGRAHRSGGPLPERPEFNGPPLPVPPPDAGDDGPPPRELRLPPVQAGLFSGVTNGFYYIVWLRDGVELSRSESAPSDVVRPLRIRGVGPTPTLRTRDSRREIYQFVRLGECILVGRSILPELEGFRRFALVLWGLGGAITAFGLAGGWWLANRAIRPIKEISSAAAHIAGGDLSHRINVAETDNELGQLAGVLNLTFARLEAAFVRQQQFTADASHELRTPVAVILSQTQAILARDRNPDDYREGLRACQRAAERMRTLTESLLLLARLDAGEEAFQRQPLDLGQIATESTELIRPLVAERDIQLRTEILPAPAVGDAPRLAQAVLNLLTNAITHSPAGAEVWLRSGRDDNGSFITVSDSGPGISPEELPHIFERFYRGDPSRSANKGGTGLGLAITKSIVEALGGSVTVASEPGIGASFTLQLPVE